uniref:VWF/SSPO/Zonadhesin-like cysteine-rich domain-containing protein n=1 Tax=Cyprinodon variegatus TaxID=28743 RepID=A0A3Q2EFT2_CYPVA
MDTTGYILSGGVCVPHAECGCSFEGQYYRSGETVILDADCGRRCSCSDGSMSCNPHSCGQHESCTVEDGERGCKPNSFSTCWIRGPGSYQTFDGLMYQYPGASNFSSSEYCGVISSHSGPFTSCWGAVDPGLQVNACVEILQGSRDPASKLCEVLQDYALMCQHNGVFLGQWRNATGCGMFFCPS